MQKRATLFFFLQRSISKPPPLSLPQHPSLKTLVSTNSLHFLPRFPLSPSKWFLSSSSYCSQSAAAAASLLSEPTTSDGMTVDSIVAKGWPILDEGDGDWKSQAAAIAQSVQLIKKRLQWRKMIDKLEQLSVVLNKPDIWDDPIFAGRVSREHGGLMSKVKEVNGFEQELLEHIDMLKLAREENDEELELVRSCF